jgi:hypothetical protein
MRRVYTNTHHFQEGIARFLRLRCFRRIDALFRIGPVFCCRSATGTRVNQMPRICKSLRAEGTAQLGWNAWVCIRCTQNSLGKIEICQDFQAAY